MESQSAEYFDILLETYLSKEVPLFSKYKQLRQLLDRICRELTANESLQMTDMAARLNFLASSYNLDSGELYRLHAFRLTANDILNERLEPTTELLQRDIRTLSYTIRKLFQVDIPLELYQLLPKSSFNITGKALSKVKIKRLRVCYQYTDEEYLYVTPVDILSEELIKVNYNQLNVNDYFNDTVKALWQFAQLNLLDVAVDDRGVYIPSFIVLEPDYLIDISSLAECFKDYGAHPGNYILNKLIPITNTRPLLVGNIANLFLDEWIHAEEEADYVACMQKAFKNYSVEIAACRDLYDKEKEREFFQDCRMHFNNIREVIQNTFEAVGYNLNRQDAVLEPSYVCEALGIQGRLDYMQRDLSAFVEMKSGKADEYTFRNKIEPKENNRIQMLLYMAVLEYNMEKNHREQHPYLLYTRYPLLYPARTSWAMVKRAINLRNLIVANEYAVQLHNNIEYTRNMLSGLTPEILNEKNLCGRFWENYLCPSLESFRKVLYKLSSLEQKYYYSLYNFITKELYLSKSGDISYEGKSGASSLWLSTFAEKCEAGEILYDLKVLENHASAPSKASVSFSLPSYKADFLPNFRMGDIVMFYERNTSKENVTNKLVFKGSIEEISITHIKIRLRSNQLNAAVLPNDSLYAVEHDVMDTGYKTMYQGLYTFATAEPDRRKLLLSCRKPLFDTSFANQINSIEDEFERIALRAESAKDYFLLLGPPGTGKTSRALKKMVERFHQQSGKQILLLAYTNRAVDEICKAVLSIDKHIDFIRIGSELACEIPYREFLLENRLAGCMRRSEVTNIISHSRIVIGTVASIANKPELFKLKTFDVAIVDEATQILEPHLLGILCARNQKGKNSVGKFILIGDHKQLPAVVLQNKDHSAIYDEELNESGLFNLKDSLFERLYRRHQCDKDTQAIEMLSKQGRMHPIIAEFPNKEFYEGKLSAVGLPHQLETFSLENYSGSWGKLLNNRIAFIASPVYRKGTCGKINIYEASIVANLAAKIYMQYGDSFEVSKTLGIISPYRSQLAMIRHELSKLNIPVLQHITIDTVERFQGSERDVIIYSFCVNYLWQLKHLVNLIEENNKWIDRKLNVVLTRARKQIFLVGVPELLQEEAIYCKLLKGVQDTFIFADLECG